MFLEHSQILLISSFCFLADLHNAKSSYIKDKLHEIWNDGSNLKQFVKMERHQKHFLAKIVNVSIQ